MRRVRFDVNSVGNMCFSAYDRERVRKKSGGRCAHCGKEISTRSYRFSIDHAVPKSLGGSDEDYNLVALCRSCNTSKTNKLVEPYSYFKYLDGGKLQHLVNYTEDFLRNNIPFYRKKLFIYDEFNLRVNTLTNNELRFKKVSLEKVSYNKKSKYYNEMVRVIGKDLQKTVSTSRGNLSYSDISYYRIASIIGNNEVLVGYIYNYAVGGTVSLGFFYNKSYYLSSKEYLSIIGSILGCLVNGLCSYAPVGSSLVFCFEYSENDNIGYEIAKGILALGGFFRYSHKEYKGMCRLQFVVPCGDTVANILSKYIYNIDSIPQEERYLLSESHKLGVEYIHSISNRAVKKPSST